MTSSANISVDPLMMDLFRVELENNTRTLESGLVTAERDQTPERIEPSCGRHAPSRELPGLSV